MESIDRHEGYLSAREHGRAARRARSKLSAPAVRDLLLVGLAVCSGAVDAISFLALGKVFSAFMTGNIVFLAFGLTGAEGPNIVRVGVALIGFGAGVAAAVKIVKCSTGTAVWPRRVSLALGLSALLQAAFLAGWIATSGRPAAGVADVLIGLSALAMGAQTGAVLSLGVPGIFTTAATATVAGLASEFAGWSQSPNERWRLAGVLAGVCVGAGAGAQLLSHARSYAPVLPVIGTLLVIIAASRLLEPSASAAAGDER